MRLHCVVSPTTDAATVGCVESTPRLISSRVLSLLLFSFFGVTSWRRGKNQVSFVLLNNLPVRILTMSPFISVEAFRIRLRVVSVSLIASVRLDCGVELSGAGRTGVSVRVLRRQSLVVAVSVIVRRLQLSVPRAETLAGGVGRLGGVT